MLKSHAYLHSHVEKISYFVDIGACWIMFTITIKDLKMHRNYITSCLVLDIFIHLSLHDSHNISFTLRQRKRQHQQQRQFKKLNMISVHQFNFINSVPAFSFELMFECFAFHQRFIGPVELFVVLKTNPGCNSRSVQWKVPAPFVGHQICNIAFGVLVLVCFVIAFAI